MAQASNPVTQVRMQNAIYTGKHTILASWVGAIASAVEQDGFAWTDLTRGELADPRRCASGTRLPHEIMREIWDRAAHLTQDPAVPLRAAARLKPQALHALGYSLMAVSSLEEACRILHRQFHVISTAAALKIETTASHYTITSVSEPTVNDEGFEMFLAFLLEMFGMLQHERPTPVRLTLRRPLTYRSAGERYDSFFGVRTEFGAPQNMIVFRRSEMLAPLSNGNPTIRALADKLVSEYLETFGSGEFRTVVRSQILNLLQEGGASEEAVARALNMSSSSLARRLRMEGVTYRRLLHETQKSLALQYLEDGNLSISEIGFRLGFEDLSSLSRSFRRWTGVSPRTWRQQRQS